MGKLLEDYQRKLQKSLAHLEYSSNKIRSLTSNPSEMTEETLETWESFTARFSRTVDIFLTKYLRAYVLKNDPGFSGTLRDFVDQGEKLAVISSADLWMDFRGFRNIISHEYEEDELRENFESLRKSAVVVLALKDDLK